MNSFWSELKRRNVVRVGAAYLAGTWLSLQIADTVLPNLDAPAWIMTVLIYSAAIGFPFALIVAWYYELTPQGIKSAADTVETASVGFTGRKIDFAIIGILILAIGFLLVGRETPVADNGLLRKSIAVLPFANMSGDPDQDYFAAGITEDIITDLSRFGLFLVLSRNSTFAYKGTSADVKDIARELGVQYVLEGSVQKSGDRVRITGQLIDAIEDKHIWAERYDRKIEDIFELQDEISRSIVASVAPEYLSAEMKRAQRKETRNLDAWDSFMRGYWHFMRFTKDDSATAQDLLREAIERDPNQAHYHGMLAVIHTLEVFYGWSGSPEQSFRKALESAERGLALDDQDAQVIRSAGIVHFFMKNHDTALAYYKRAVQANPYDAESRALLGAALGVAGDYDAALHQFETAMRLSPRDLHIATWYNYLGIAAFVSGRDEEAAEWSIQATQSNPQLPGGHRTLASSYGNLGRLKEAAAAREKLQDLQPQLTVAQLRESLPYFRNPDDLERYLEGLRRAGLPD